MGLKRPTILQIIPELDTGGAELSAIEIAAAVVRAGGRAIVLSEGGRMADRLAAVGGELMVFPAATKNPFASTSSRMTRDSNVMPRNVFMAQRAPTLRTPARQTSGKFILSKLLLRNA